MLIRLAKMEDWESVYNISKKNGKLLGPVLPPEIRNHISKDECLVVQYEGEIIAFCLFTLLKKTPNLLTVNVICVKDDFRGKGLAKGMLNKLAEYGRDIKATCVKDSSSEAFWSSVGEKVEELPGKKRPICRYVIYNKSIRKKLF